MKLLAAVVGLLFAVRCGAACAQVPLPTNLVIKPPAAEVPPADAAFSGAWGNGAWDGVLPAALVVEQIDANDVATVVDAVGGSTQLGVKGGWVRQKGQIRQRELTLHLPHSTVVHFRLDASGHLIGDFTIPEGSRSNVVLRRIAGTPAQIIATAALPVQPIWQDIRISEQSKVGAAAGQDIALEVTVYRTRLAGRQPLVIMNHGSTDGELPGVPTISRYEGQARFFLAHGYNVVLPMRKGRGLSSGPMLEPSDQSVPGATQVDSAVEDLDTVVNAMRAEPWVDPARIIVAGQSRGGFLSVIYAARYPDKVAGVINVSGGWWAGRGWGVAFNATNFADAGRHSKVPQLWLYADNDHYYSLAQASRDFDGFRANGGLGEFHSVTDIHGDGHDLFGYINLWGGPVAAYLRRIDGG